MDAVLLDKTIKFNEIRIFTWHKNAFSKLWRFIVTEVGQYSKNTATNRKNKLSQFNIFLV